MTEEQQMWHHRQTSDRNNTAMQKQANWYLPVLFFILHLHSIFILVIFIVIVVGVIGYILQAYTDDLYRTTNKTHNQKTLNFCCPQMQQSRSAGGPFPTNRIMFRTVYKFQRQHLAKNAQFLMLQAWKLWASTVTMWGEISFGQRLTKDSKAWMQYSRSSSSSTLQNVTMSGTILSRCSPMRCPACRLEWQQQTRYVIVFCYWHANHLVLCIYNGGYTWQLPHTACNYDRGHTWQLPHTVCIYNEGHTWSIPTHCLYLQQKPHLIAPTHCIYVLVVDVDVFFVSSDSKKSISSMKRLLLLLRTR